MKDFGTYLWTKGPGVFVVREEAPTYAFQASEFFNFSGGESFTSKLSSLASGERVDITGFGELDDATWEHIEISRGLLLMSGQYFVFYVSPAEEDCMALKATHLYSGRKGVFDKVNYRVQPLKV